MTRASKDIKILIPAFESVSIENIEENFSELFGDMNT
jgi:hypothetical protein